MMARAALALLSLREQRRASSQFVGILGLAIRRRTRTTRRPER
jgi:hypothetical protein